MALKTTDPRAVGHLVVAGLLRGQVRCEKCGGVYDLGTRHDTCKIDPTRTR